MPSLAVKFLSVSQSLGRHLNPPPPTPVSRYRAVASSKGSVLTPAFRASASLGLSPGVNSPMCFVKERALAVSLSLD